MYLPARIAVVFGHWSSSRVICTSLALGSRALNSGSIAWRRFRVASYPKIAVSRLDVLKNGRYAHIMVCDSEFDFDFVAKGCRQGFGVANLAVGLPDGSIYW